MPARSSREISRIEGSWAKRVYFNELLKQPGLSGADDPAGAGAGRTRNRFRLRAGVAADRQQPAHAPTTGARRAYLDAARTIGSDFELRRVLSSIVKAGPMTPAVAALVLDTSGVD